MPVKIASRALTRLALAAALVAAGASYASPLQPSNATPLDGGTTAPATPMTVSIVLKVQNPEALDLFIASTVTPGSPNFRKFLSVAQFRQRFAPSNAQIKRVTDYLQHQGITVNEVYGNNLVISATGTADQFSQVFATTMHDYVDRRGRHFHRPDRRPTPPSTLQDLVLYVAGLSTESAAFRPHSTNAKTRRAALGEKMPNVVMPSGNSTATGVPGSFTTGDVANNYGVNPLYAQGITGKGMTVGIVTLANFIPDDAYQYWSQIGLSVKPNRITQVHVDGGGELSSDAGSGETSLDVEQSGGLAPGAKIVVYDAPNTDAGFIDVFYKAVSDNVADTLSVSWGGSEIYNFEVPGISNDTLAEFEVIHQVMAEAAAQGISTFAASGDDGAYDTNTNQPYPNFSKILTVDSPASDPYIVAAGGTTVPADIQAKHGVVHVATEQVWGEDYWNPYLVANYGPSMMDYYFSGGGGGGVSIYWPTPAYQLLTPGIRRTEPNQQWIYYPNSPDMSQQQHLTTLPANFRGRNVPDLSLNADWYTGYLLNSTEDGGWSAGWGGTSFSAPQLNGIFSLIAQSKGSRLGLLHPQLYGLKMLQMLTRRPLGFVDITAGDNWFYKGVGGYDQGSGLGVINAAALARALP